MNFSNQYIRLRCFGLLVFMSLNSWPAWAQVGKQISESEIQGQKIFIDATKEKTLENYEDAAFLFKEVLKKDPENHAAAYELARLYDVFEKSDKAMQMGKKAVDLAPENNWYKIVYASILKNANRPLDAAEVFKDLIKKEPNEKSHYYQMAEYLISGQKPEQAVKVYTTIEKKFGTSEILFQQKHKMYLGMGKTKKAAEELDKLVEMFPAQIEYRHLLADFYYKTGEKNKAKDVYLDILDIDDSDARANLALADDFKERGNHARYLNAIRPVFQKSDVNIDVKVKNLFPYIKMPEAERQQAGIVDAVIDLGKILSEVHPEEAKAHSIYADLLYYVKKDNKAALAEYDKTKTINPNVFVVWEQMMYINAELGRFDALAKVSAEAMDLFPNKSRAYYMNGIAGIELKQYTSAIDALEQALMMSGRNKNLRFDILNRLGIAYFKAGKNEKSNSSFEKALKLNPQSYIVLNNYSTSLAERGEQLDKAKNMSSLANELKPNVYYLQDTYGFVLYKMKDYKSAKDWLSRALKSGGDNKPNVLERYGDVLFRLDEKDNAIVYWQKALEKGGDADLLSRKINDRRLYE